MPDRRSRLRSRPSLDFGPTNLRLADEVDTLSQARISSQQLQRLRSTITPEMVSRTNQLLSDHASLSGRLLQGILQTDPYNEAADELAEMDEGDDDEGGGGLLGFGKQMLGHVAGGVADGLSLFNENVIKPTFRTVDLLSDSGFRELSRGIMVTGALRQVGIQGGPTTFEGARETFKDMGDSPLTNVLQGQGGFTDQGTGYFFNGEASERSAQERTLEVNGQEANFGRYIANNVVGQFQNPGDFVYDLTAGLSEFAGAVVLDPLAPVGGALGKGAKAGRQLSRGFDDAAQLAKADEITKLDRLKFRAGLVDADKQRTIIAERTRDFLTKQRDVRGKSIYEQVAEADEYDIFERFAKSPSQRQSLEIVRELGGTKTAGEAQEKIEGLIRSGLIEERGFFSGPGAFIRRHALESENLVSKQLKVALDPDSRLSRILPLTAEAKSERKFAGLAPSGFIHSDDIDEAAFKLDSMMRQAEVPRDKRAEVFGKIAGVDKGDDAMLAQVWTDSMKAVETKLLEQIGEGASGKARGLGTEKYTRSVIGELSTKWDEEMHRVQQSFGRVYGSRGMEKLNASYAQKTKITAWDGTEMDFVAPHPTATAELGSMKLALPDPAHIRRAAEKGHLARTVYARKGWGTATTAVNSFTNIFKTSVLIRPAFMVREFMEGQLALTAGRFQTTALNHPVDWFMQAWHLGDEGWREVFDPSYVRATAKAEPVAGITSGPLSTPAGTSTAKQLGVGVAERFARVSSREQWTDLVGNKWNDVARKENMLVTNAQGQVNLSGMSRETVARHFEMVPFDKPSQENLVFWTKEMGRLRASPEYVKMAELDSVEDWKTWATENPTGRGYMDDLLGPTLKRGDVTRDEALDELAEIVRERLGDVTGGFDEDLMAAFREGNIPMPQRMRNGRLVNADWNDKPTQVFMAQLRRKFDEGKKPLAVKAEKVEEASGAFKSQMLDNMKDTIFNWGPTKFTKYAVFKESTVNRAAELMDMAASDELRDEIIEAAIHAWKLTPDIQADAAYRALVEARNQTRGMSGIIDNIEDYNDLVLSKAVDDVTATVFDVSNRGAAQDTFGTFLPFLDAWKEMMTRWPRLLKDNPAFFVRGMTGVRELQNQGQFYTNDYGEMVFRYPGSGALVKAITTMQQGRADGSFNVALEGRVAGLNIATDSIGPGFGPLVQLSAGFFKDPTLDDVRNMIAPFGVKVDSAGDLLNPATYLDQLVPAWMSKALTGFGDEDSKRQFNSTAAQLMDAFSMSGDYNLDDPASVAKMVEDAEQAAKIVLLTRSMYQAGGPTGPGAAVEVKADDADFHNPNWDPEKDPTGKWFTVQALASDYHRLAEVHGWDVAAEKWFDLYGKDPYFIAQAASSSEGRELPVSQEGDNWMRRNADVVDRYSHVAGFFAPVDEEDDFSFTAYNRQFLQGQRKTLSAGEQAKLATSTRARAVWRAVQERTEGLPTRDKEQARREIRDKLEAVAPNWRNPGVTSSLPADEKIRQLEAAAQDERLASNPMTRPLRAYLEARQVALSQIRQATGRPNATLSGEDGASFREELRGIGRELQMKYPEFAGVWSSLLVNEIEED